MKERTLGETAGIRLRVRLRSRDLARIRIRLRVRLRVIVSLHLTTTTTTTTTYPAVGIEYGEILLITYLGRCYSTLLWITVVAEGFEDF
jgi:hypothetical protein